MMADNLSIKSFRGMQSVISWCRSLAENICKQLSDIALFVWMWEARWKLLLLCYDLFL